VSYAQEPLDQIKLLERWFTAAADGDWEHSGGITISTLDNPGWSLSVALKDSQLEGRPFVARSVERSEHDWCVCRIEGDQFRGYGGPGNLHEIIGIFLDWAVAP
jgi:hypothetical protein